MLYESNLTGELIISDFPNLTFIFLDKLEVNKVKLVRIPELKIFSVNSCSDLITVEGLEYCAKIDRLITQGWKVFAFLEN